MCASDAVLLVGFDPRTGLAVARSLHRRGKKVFVGTVAEWEAPVRSRAIAGFFKLPGLHRPSEEFIAALVDLIRIREIDTVIPLTDRALTSLAPHDALLRTRVRLLGPTAGQLGLIIDKAATHRLATQLNVPVPRSVVTTDASGTRVDTEDLAFPLFVKTSDKGKTYLGTNVPADDGCRCTNRAELDAFLARRGSSKNLLIQEHVSGEDVGMALLMKAGQVLSSFQYRARKLLPAEGGVCVLACTEKVDTEMFTCAVRLLRALDWDGVAQIDFRHDARTGRFALLEINGRFWGSTAVAVLAGADFPYQVWQLAHGETPCFKPYRVGMLVRWLEGDFRRLIAIAASGSSGGNSVLREGLRFLADFRPSVRGMFWAWRDPFAGFDIFMTMGRAWMMARFTGGSRVNPTRLRRVKIARISSGVEV